MWLAIKAAYKAFGQAYRAAYLAFTVQYGMTEGKAMLEDIKKIFK